MVNERGVSEIIGAILLVSLVILGVMIVAVLFLSQPPPQEIPQVNAIAGNNSSYIFLLHDGGDPLTPMETVIRIDGRGDPVPPEDITLLREDGTVEASSWTSGEWSVGKTLRIRDDQTPQSVTLVYSGASSQALLLTATFIEAPPTGPHTTHTTAMTTTATTTVTTTATTTVTTTATTSPTPTPTPDCGTISGYKWNDLDGDGSWDSGEPGLSGWTIEAYECHTGNCNNPTYTGSAITNSTGYYILTGLTYQPSTRYKIQEVLQSGWQPTSPSQGYYIEKLEPPGSPGQPGKCYETGINFGNRQATPPVADFTGDPTSGTAPLTVQFTDTSTGDPTEWAWDVNNDGVTDYTIQNPQHVYMSPGSYTVKLTVTNSAGSNTIIKTNYITVTSSSSVYNIYLSADKSGSLQTGNFIQFRVTGPYSFIKHGNVKYDLAVNDIVKLEITTDLTGSIYATSTYISDFDFDNVRLYINGDDKGSKDIGNNDIWISDYDSYISTLKLVVPADNEWTNLMVNGIYVIYGFDNREINIFYLKTDQFGVMNLECTNDVYYNGGATDYPVIQ
jgi:PKD repeat protein